VFKKTSQAAQRHVTSLAFRAVVFIGITEHASLVRKICSSDSMQRDRTEKVFCNARKKVERQIAPQNVDTLTRAVPRMHQ
jgi:hypothetical protein